MTYLKTLFCLVLLFGCVTGFSSSVVERFGFLRVSNGYLESDGGERVQLTGMSSHGLHWYPHFVTKDSIRYLRDDWGSTVFRAAMYTGEGGYISNRSVKNTVHQVVRDSIELGIYVIIDWHILRDNNPLSYVNEAKEFFREMAETYGEHPNVIYEICNEPNGWGVSWGGAIKPYAHQVIPVIREYAPRSIVIVGTPNYSSDISAVENDPLEYDNVMYALHFYGNHNGDWQRGNVIRLLQKGIAVFATEWGTSSHTGDGGPYIDQSVKWLNFMREHKISWTNWNFSNNRESSAAFHPWVNSNVSTWNDNSLKAGAKLVKDYIKQGLVHAK